MATASEILNDPAYTNANEATKQAIFDKHIASDPSFVDANPATQAAIRQRFGLAQPSPTPLQTVDVLGHQFTPEQYQELAGKIGIVPSTEKVNAPVGEKEATVLSQLIGGTKQIGSDYSTLVKSLGSQERANKAALEELQNQQRIQEEVGKTRGIQEVKEAYAKEGFPGASKEVASQVPGAIAASTPQMVTTIGGNIVGGVLTESPLGAYVGGFATLYPQFYMQNLAEQADQQLQKGEPVNVNRARAAGAAVVQAGIEEAGTIYQLGKNFIKSFVKTIPKNELEKKLVTKTLVEQATQKLGTVGKAVGRTAFEESIVNPSQTLLSRWQSGQDILSDEAIKQYGEDIYGSLLQAPLGIATGAHEVHRARKTLAEAGIDWEGNPIQGPQPQTEGQKALSNVLATASGQQNLPKEPEVVKPEVLLDHAKTRLQELEIKANGRPAQETVDENGQPLTIPAQPAQPMTEKEVAELKFLQEHQNNPDKLAEGYGVTIGKPTVTGSQDIKAALGELEGQEMPIPPIYQPPVETKPVETKPVEPEKPAEPEAEPEKPETPPEEETPPTVIKEPPKLQAVGKVLDSVGKEHELTTVGEAVKAGFSFDPINSDKPMYAKTDLDGVNAMVRNLFEDKGGTSYTNMTASSYKVTPDQSKVIPTTQKKNQVSVEFRPDTLSGRQTSPNEFQAYDTAHKAIESFTVHNPSNRFYLSPLVKRFFDRGFNEDGSVTYTLKRVKSAEELAAEKEELSKKYLAHINAPRGKLRYNYQRLRTPGLNSFQQAMEKYTKLGDALRGILPELEKIAKSGWDEGREASSMPFTMELKNKEQVEMYVDIIKHLLKVEPAMKTSIFMDPHIIGSSKRTVPGFYNRVTNNLAMFANGYLDTFIHEAIHAATVHYIEMNPNDPKVQKLEKILEASRKHDRKTRKGEDMLYGNTNLKEFIAEVFSSPEFIQHLSSMDPIFDKAHSTSVFDNVKSIIRNMLKAMGVNVEKNKTALDEVMDLSSELFTGKTLEGYLYDKKRPVTEDAMSINRPIEYEFSMNDLPSRSTEIYTIPVGTELFHGAHETRANEILETGSILKSKRNIKSNGGLLTEGGLLWFGDKDLATGHARSEIDVMKAHWDKEKGISRNPGKVFVTVSNKPIRLVGRNFKMNAKQADRLNKTLGLPKYKHLQKGDSLDLAAGRAHDYQRSNVERYRTDQGEMSAPWPIILKELGFDGYYDKSGIALNLDEIQASKVLEATDENLAKLESNTDETISENQRPLTEEDAQQEQQSRQIFNYRGDPVSINEWEIPEQGPIAARLSKWFQYFADEDAVLTRIMKTLRSLNRYISDMTDIEKKQELKNSRISAQLMVFANEEVNPIVKEMLAKGVSLEEINKYLLAKHSPAYNDRMNNINHKVDRNGNIVPYALKDRASSMLTQDALDYLNNLTPERKQTLENIAKKWYAIRDKTQKLLVESGQETQETIDLWNETYPFYVPLNREQEQQAVPNGLRTGAGVDVRGDFSKRAMGSEKQVISIADALLYQRERAVARAENSKVGESIYRLFLEHPNPNFAISVNPDAIHDRDALIQELENMGYTNAADIADNIMAEPKERYLRKVKPSDFVIDPTTGFPIPNTPEVVDARISRNARFGDNVLTFKINGRERYVFFSKKDPNATVMVHTLKNLNAQELGAFLRANRFITHYLGQVYTVLNPIFGIVNGFKDYPFGMINLSTTPIRGKQLQVSAKIMPAMIGIMSVLRKERAGGGYSPMLYKWQRIYNEALDAGFQTSNRYAILHTGEDRTYIANLLDQFKDNNAKQVFRYVINMTYDFSSMIENGVRLAAYQQMREAGHSPQESASVAKNLTINFDKKGSRTTVLRSLYLFFNASIQGTVRLGKTLAGPSGGRIITGGVLLGVMQAMMMAAAGFKDDDPPEYIREHNLIIPTGDGKYNTIPMPYGLNILPNTGRILTEAAIDITKHKGLKDAHVGKHALNWTNAFFSAFSPFGNQGLSMNALVPTAWEAPFAISEHGTNTNAFGQTISRKDSYTRPTPGFARTKESGTEWGKEFARWMNRFTLGTDAFSINADSMKGAWSPTGDDIDFLASTYLGPVLGSINKTYKYIKAKTTGEEVPAYQVPVLGRFQGETNTKPVITSRFYNNLNAMYEHEYSIKNLRDDPKAREQYMKDHPDARGWRMAEGYEAQINNITAKKKQAQLNHAPQEVIQRLDNIKIIKMNQFNDAIERLRNQ